MLRLWAMTSGTSLDTMSWSALNGQLPMSYKMASTPLMLRRVRIPHYPRAGRSLVIQTPALYSKPLLSSPLASLLWTPDSWGDDIGCAECSDLLKCPSDPSNPFFNLLPCAVPQPWPMPSRPDPDSIFRLHPHPRAVWEPLTCVGLAAP